VDPNDQESVTGRVVGGAEVDVVVEECPGPELVGVPNPLLEPAKVEVVLVVIPGPFFEAPSTPVSSPAVKSAAVNSSTKMAAHQGLVLLRVGGCGADTGAGGA
jgi:hypothetical protein